MQHGFESFGAGYCQEGAGVILDAIQEINSNYCSRRYFASSNDRMFLTGWRRNIQPRSEKYIYSAQVKQLLNGL